MILKTIDAIAVKLDRDMAAARGTAGTPTALSGRGPYRWSQDYPVLYSTRIETALIRIATSDGLIGWGEAQAPLAPEVACSIIASLLRPVLEGQDFDGSVAAIDALWMRMYSTMRVRGQTGGFMLDAISGIDLALWDLAGKSQGKPVSALLSNSPKARVPAYLSGLAGESEADRIAFAKHYYNCGFRHFKLYYETNWQSLLDVFDALPDDAEVAVDALWHLDPEHCIAQAKELDAREALWLECPLMPEEWEAHARLAAAIRTPLALGESYRTRYELRPIFDCIGFCQPDLGRSGITESRRIAEAAAAKGIAIVPHLSIALGPQAAAALQFAAGTANCNLSEFNPRVLETANRFLKEPLRLDGPDWITPQAPGLGIEMDWDLLSQAL